MEYWTVTLKVFTPEKRHKIDFTTRFAHGEAFDIPDASAALNKAYEKAEENGFEIHAVESMELASGTFQQ